MNKVSVAGADDPIPLDRLPAGRYGVVQGGPHHGCVVLKGTCGHAVKLETGLHWDCNQGSRLLVCAVPAGTRLTIDVGVEAQGNATQ